MSELITKKTAYGDFHWQLLTTVSALAICATIYTVDAARADDADRSTVWVELGGQLERVESEQDAFLPPFLTTQPRPGFEIESPATTQRPPRYAFGGEAKITLAPAGIDWHFLAAIRFGRSNRSKHLHQQTSKHFQSGTNILGTAPVYEDLTAFGDTVTKHVESHAVVDFMAGRDVGLGFGRNSNTTFDFGVRFAQFNSKSSNTLRAVPDPFVERIPQPPNPVLPSWHKYNTYAHHHAFYAQDSISRSFSGIGPSLSLSGSQSFLGNQETGEVAFDWGANAAVLFGRQNVHGSHKTSGEYFTPHVTPWGFAPKSTYSPPAKPIARSRSVVVPNVGGFAGLTFQRSSAKVSLGYRADFFFGAMDGGIDSRKTYDRNFYGPFATISIGLGG